LFFSGGDAGAAAGSAANLGAAIGIFPFPIFLTFSHQTSNDRGVLIDFVHVI